MNLQNLYYKRLMIFVLIIFYTYICDTILSECNLCFKKIADRAAQCLHEAKIRLHKCM